MTTASPTKLPANRLTPSADHFGKSTTMTNYCADQRSDQRRGPASPTTPASQSVA